MKTLILSPVVSLFALTFTLNAATKPTPDTVDLQLRIPLHIQAQPTNWPAGLALWGVLPNAFAEGNNTSGLFAAGPLIQYDQHGSWIEFLGGTKINDDHYNDPFMNIRLIDKHIPRINLAGDIEYFPQREMRRLYTLSWIDTPVNIGKQTWRVGIESENIIHFTDKKNSFGAGPRLQYVLPLDSPTWSVAITTSYQFRNDRDFVRIYLGLIWKPFGKK